MLSWLPRRRARMAQIDDEAEAMVRDFGAEAYYQARQRDMRPAPRRSPRIGVASQWQSPKKWDGASDSTPRVGWR